MHEAGHGVVGIGVPVVLDALDQGAGAVADAGDGHPDLIGLSSSVGPLHLWTAVHCSVPQLFCPSTARCSSTACEARARSASIRRSSHEMSRSVASVVCSTRDRA